jgi:threonine/homoserine efflux transporter RhtA
LALATVVAFVCLFAAIDRIGSARVTIASAFEPVIASILAAAFLDEIITLRTRSATESVTTQPLHQGHSTAPSRKHRCPRIRGRSRRTHGAG